ncbi:MAG TPA: hypothetical protein VFK76_07220 [Gaiellaceae bacterium]|nr:hypothetical protein [Gaiellaceae bacterium]
MERLMRRLTCGLLLSLTVATMVGPASTPAAVRHTAAGQGVVASLQPEATMKLWRQLVATRASSTTRVQADCRPLRAVFYAATDYLRLTTKLAANASPCADYYVSVPPLVADKTIPRPNAAPRIRALGPTFHAMAEFSFAAWTKWVATTGSSWFTAGVTARARMAAAGYDFSKGDTWVVNEASSAVRTNTGQARANLRELLRGLYEGDGTRPSRGAVFVTGIGQQTNNLGLYQTNLQNWLSDSAFWTDMSTYVSDWSQEVYGDVRNWAVPGADTATRRDYLNDYLEHVAVLAAAGPPTIDAARSFLQTAFSPLANAAWERDTAYGWTAVPVAQMASYVSAEVYALRYFSSVNAQATDHWGFAWAPRNGSGLSASEFAAQTNQILDRLAAAIHDSDQVVDPEDPGSAACGAPSENLCVGDVDGSRLNAAWQTFRVWTQPVLTFTTPPQTIPAGTPSAPMLVSLLSSSGRPQTTGVPITVTLSSSSAKGTFSTTPSGPWSPTLTLTIPAGTGTTTPAFYYLDTTAGSPIVTASATGATSGTQTETVTPGPLASVVISPKSVTMRTRASIPLTAVGMDTYGNRVPASASWSLAPSTIGKLAPKTGPKTTLTTLRATGPASVTATAGTFSATAAVRVNPGLLRIGSVAYRSRPSSVLVTPSAVDTAGRPISRASISILVRRGGRRIFTGRATTGAAGKATFAVGARALGCYTTTIRVVSARGFTWSGRTPRNRYCRR